MFLRLPDTELSHVTQLDLTEGTPNMLLITHIYRRFTTLGCRTYAQLGVLSFKGNELPYIL
jgi:hypothetical protein